MADPQYLSTDPNAGDPLPPPQPPTVAAQPEMRRPIASGRGTQFDPTRPMQAVDTAMTPLARPTGVAAIDGLTSPVGLASLALGVGGIAKAGLAGGAAAAVREALLTAAPVVKYEATKTGLRALGVPESAAAVIATAVSGLKRGAKVNPTALSAEDQAMLDAIERRNAAIATREAPKPVAPVSNPAATPPVTASVSETRAKELLQKFGGRGPTSPGETVSGGTPPPADRPPAPVPATAPTAASPPPEAPVTPKPKLTAAEFQAYAEEYKKLRVKGLTDAQARAAIDQARTLNQMLGLKTPTPTETKFPKGFRGGAPKDE